MNATDKKKAADVLGEIENLKSLSESLAEQVRALADAEQEKFDNLPEGLQASDRGQAIETAAGQLQEAADALDNGDLNAAVDALGEVANA